MSELKLGMNNSNFGTNQPNFGKNRLNFGGYVTTVGTNRMNTRFGLRLFHRTLMREVGFIVVEYSL